MGCDYRFAGIFALSMMINPRCQQGIILFAILIFLMVLMLLALGALTNSQLQSRMGHNSNAAAQEFQATEAGLRLGEQQLLYAKKPVCFSPTPLPKSQNNNSWINQSHYCHFNFAHMAVHYFIEQLPGTPCLRQNNGASFQGAFYRVTAWTALAANYPVILQSTYAAPTTNLICMQPSILAGRLAWRELQP
jgi:Tfp pilus assembly protein PilX